MNAFIRQFAAVFWMHLRDSPTRLGALAVSLAGAAGTTFILVSVLSIAYGVKAASERAGSRTVTIIMSADAAVESASSLRESDVVTIRDALGESVVSPERVSTVDTISQGGEAGAQVVARALTDAGVRMRERFRIVEGRGFAPGKFEVVVGRALARDIAGLRVGGTVTGAAHDWNIVGVFDDGGSVSESEVWMDLDSARLETGSRGAVSSIHVISTQDVGRQIGAANSQTPLQLVSEREYQASQSVQLVERVRWVAIALAIILSTGAIVATINTMYSAIAARQRSLATMRAVGFGAAPVAAAVFAECVLLGLAGGVAGGVIAWALADGWGLSLLNTATRSPLAFDATITLTSLLEGIAVGAAIGALAAVLPGYSVARMPVLEGLRAP